MHITEYKEENKILGLEHPTEPFHVRSLDLRIANMMTAVVAQMLLAQLFMFLQILLMAWALHSLMFMESSHPSHIPADICAYFNKSEGERTVSF